MEVKKGKTKKILVCNADKDFALFTIRKNYFFFAVRVFVAFRFAFAASFVSAV